MAILKIRKCPDACLVKTAQPVKEISQEEQNLLCDMAETMYANNGIGLAAPQIGVDKRMIVVDVGTGLMKLINPEITAQEGKDTFEEGCLSVPGITVNVTRAKKIKIRALDQNGAKIEKEFGGLAAKAIQQEIDHVDGKLIFDYLPWHKKSAIRIWLYIKNIWRKKC